MNCPSCNKILDLVFSFNKSHNFFQEFHCHKCQLVLIVNCYMKYHPFTNMMYNKTRKGHGRGFS